MDHIDLNGYHGTTNRHCDSIRSSGKFIISSKCEGKHAEWLGKGIYFYAEVRDAEEWADWETRKPQNLGTRPAVITVEISCKNSEYKDLSIPANKAQFDSVLEQADKKVRKYGSGAPNFKSREEKRYFYCNLYRKLYPAKVIAFEFPSPRYDRYGFPTDYKFKKQICVSDNSYIKIIKAEVIS